MKQKLINFGKWLLGILAILLGFFLSRKKSPSEKETELEVRKAEIDQQLEEIEKKEEKLEEKIKEGFSNEEILEHWNNRGE